LQYPKAIKNKTIKFENETPENKPKYQSLKKIAIKGSFQNKPTIN
jgi:hypothetical protein